MRRPLPGVQKPAERHGENGNFENGEMAEGRGAAEKPRWPVQAVKAAESEVDRTNREIRTSCGGLTREQDTRVMPMHHSGVVMRALSVPSNLLASRKCDATRELGQQRRDMFAAT